MTQTEVPVNVEVPLEKDESEMNEKVIKQVEYYFGDNNLPRDKFIKEECSKNEGWMPIETLLRFNRVKDLLKTIPENGQVAKVAEIIKASELVNVDEAGLKIRRNPDIPIPDGTSENRTVYLKGFSKTETKLDDLLEFFGKKYEGMQAVLMRHYKEKAIETETKPDDGETENGTKTKIEPKLVWTRKFKGSVFVVFKTPEQAKKILDEEISFQGTPITIKMLHSDYRALKATEYKERVAARNKSKNSSKDLEADQAKAAKVAAENERVQEDIVNGALLRVKNIPNNFSREEFKAKWYAATNESDFQIIFADFQKGDTEGVVRLAKEGSAAEALKLLPEGKLKANDETEMEFTGFTEEEEKAYLEEVVKKRLDRKRKPNFGGGGRGRGRGRGGKRRRF